MLRRLDAKVPDHLEEPLIGLADLLGLSCFSSPCLIASGEGEEAKATGLRSRPVESESRLEAKKPESVRIRVFFRVATSSCSVLKE